jgi:hypothetical protein
MIVFNFGLEHWIMILQLVVGVVLPLLVGLVTNAGTSAAVKAWLLAALNVAASLGAEMVDALTNGTTYDLGGALIAALGTFILGVGMHYGLYRPTGASAAVQSVGAGRTPAKHDVE